MDEPASPLDLLDQCWAPGGPLNPEWDEEKKVVRYTDLGGNQREEPAESLDAWMAFMLS
jgi:hypothetical protein